MIGRSINNYLIRARIGQGGMGTVYLAEHPFMGRKVAIKILRRSLLANEEIVALFMNEARAATAIRHPNIVDVIDVGRLPDGQPYLMMEFLEGETLAERLARMRRLPPPDALDFVAQTADALAVAHARGIVHRDLKPENLLLVPDLGLARGERVKVLDFGIAKLLNGPGPSDCDSQLFVLGSPHYVAPEQCRGPEKDVDHRADIYALGGLLYHALCGVPPFASEDVGGLLAMQVCAQPVPPRALDPGIPPHVEAAILKALAKEPHERFASMGALVEALGLQPGVRSLTTTRVALARASDTLRLPRVPQRSERRRRPLPLLLAAALAVAAVASWRDRLPQLPITVKAGASALAAQLDRLAQRAPWRRPVPVTRQAADLPRPVIVPMPEEAPAERPRSPAPRARSVVVMGKASLAKVPRFSREVLDREDLWGRRY